jgi:hypothetical protein
MYVLEREQIRYLMPDIALMEMMMMNTLTIQKSLKTW